MTSPWNAAAYDRMADPQTAWGAIVLDRLPLQGDERVLDAGCGTGRVTEQLAARLPNGRVVALDASPEMLAEARRRLGRFGSQVEFVEADLARPLPLPAASVDAVLSTATFHWIKDHETLFANLAAVMRPGGRLAAQCGGRGNVATLEAVVRSLGHGGRGSHHFAGPDATRRRLEAAGFVDVEAWLSEEPTTFEPGEPFEAFLETVCLRDILPRLDETERAAFVRRVAERLPGAQLDYVRLNILATRA